VAGTGQYAGDHRWTNADLGTLAAGEYVAEVRAVENSVHVRRMTRHERLLVRPPNLP